MALLTISRYARVENILIEDGFIERFYMVQAFEKPHIIVLGLEAWNRSENSNIC